MPTTASGAPVRRRAPSLDASASLMERATHTLEACRALLYMAATDTAALDQDGDTSAPAIHLEQAVTQLDRMIATLNEWLQRLRETGGESESARLHQVLAELYALRHEADTELLRVRGAMLRGVAAALNRLAGMDSVAQIVRRAPVELCATCGFDRCLLFRVSDSSLVLESLHFAEDHGWQVRFADYLRRHPPTVDPRDPETELLRRRVAILVTDPTTRAGGLAEAVEAWRTDGYVAAPVIVRGTVIGTLHADRHFSEVRIDAFARDLLAAFAAGLSYAVERGVLLDRTRAELRRMHEAMISTEASMRQLINAGVSLRGIEGDSIAAALRDSVLPAHEDSRGSALLTRRELEVVDLMAQGASNADIATALVISEGTVKSHVKHVLRKLRAANRAQAVSTYMRLRAP